MKAAIVAATLFCIGLIGIGVFFATRETASRPRIIAMNEAYTKRVAAGGWEKGPSNAPVIVEEYADFQCPGCGALQPILSEALQQSSDYVQFIYRNYPLPSHNKARLAAQGAEAAGRQGKFWEMHDIIFTNQSRWEQKTLTSFREDVLQYAQALGLNMEQFKLDLSDNDLNQQINKDITLGNTLPVTQTPTLLINGNMVQYIPQTSTELAALFAQARDAKAATSQQ